MMKRSWTSARPRDRFFQQSPPKAEGLQAVNAHLVRAYVQAVKPGKEVTLDVDAHLVETAKRGAEYCYEGYKAFQPAYGGWYAGPRPGWR